MNPTFKLVSQRTAQEYQIVALPVRWKDALCVSQLSFAKTRSGPCSLILDRVLYGRFCVATIESVGSSTRIEGARLSDAEVEKVLSGLRSESFASRDEQEVASYADAMDMIFDGFESITITENHIKQLHGVLLKYSSKDEDHRGEYKKVPNDVQAFGPDGKSLGVVFETATPFETPGWMTELVDWFNRSIEEETQHPLILIGIFIVVFLAIHPFKPISSRVSVNTVMSSSLPTATAASAACRASGFVAISASTRLEPKSSPAVLRASSKPSVKKERWPPTPRRNAVFS
jgi:hypothetical protein